MVKALHTSPVCTWRCHPCQSRGHHLCRERPRAGAAHVAARIEIRFARAISRLSLATKRQQVRLWINWFILGLQQSRKKKKKRRNPRIFQLKTGVDRYAQLSPRLWLSLSGAVTEWNQLVRCKTQRKSAQTIYTRQSLHREILCYLTD